MSQLNKVILIVLAGLVVVLLLLVVGSGACSGSGGGGTVVQNNNQASSNADLGTSANGTKADEDESAFDYSHISGAAKDMTIEEFENLLASSSAIVGETSETQYVVDIDSVASYEELVDQPNALPSQVDIPVGSNPREPSVSPGITTAKEAYALAEKRGFSNLPIKVNFSISGKYEEIESVDANDTKYPSYKIAYISSEDVVWTIYIIDGCVTAVPLGDTHTSISKEIILSEQPQVTQYDASRNQYSDFTIEECASQGATCIQVPIVDKATIDQFSVIGLEAMV